MKFLLIALLFAGGAWFFKEVFQSKMGFKICVVAFCVAECLFIARIILPMMLALIVVLEIGFFIENSQGKRLDKAYIRAWIISRTWAWVDTWVLVKAYILKQIRPNSKEDVLLQLPEFAPINSEQD